MAITGPNAPKVSKLLARVHCANVGFLLMMSAAVTSLTQVYPKIWSGASALADIGAAPADDDAELALVHHLAVIGLWPVDGVAMRHKGARGLEQIKRLVGAADPSFAASSWKLFHRQIILLGSHGVRRRTSERQRSTRGAWSRRTCRPERSGSRRPRASRTQACSSCSNLNHRAMT